MVSIYLKYMIPKKKGRKPKSYYENLKLLELSNNSLDCSNIETLNNISNNVTNTDISNNVVHKKRGRKPKGGKIIEEKKVIVELNQKPNIILHLNCKLNEIQLGELNYDPNIYNINNFDNANLNYDFINTNILPSNQNIFNNNTENSNNEPIEPFNNENILPFNENIEPLNNESINLDINDITNLKQPNTITNKKNEKILYNKIISKKLEDLSKKLKFNNVNKKSACFWCTYQFDNEPIMIPKYELKNTYYCYGNFCSPECACSYLMNENIESSHKFERYYLLNNIYCKIYNYEKNIKFAPSPFYTLDKYYGNLNIQEYRQLLKNERLLLVVDKPLSKLLPELYDENEDYILNKKSINKNSYKLNVN